MDIAKQRDFLLGKSNSKQTLKEAKIFPSPINEMAHISGKLQAAIDSVIEAYPELDGLELKRKIKNDQDVIDALDGSDLYENQLNKYIALKKGRRELKKRGRKPTSNNGEQPLNEMAKIKGDLKAAIDAVIASNPELDGLALKKAIRSNKEVQTALDGEVLHDNQLNRYIASNKPSLTNKSDDEISPDLNTLTDLDSEISYENEDENEILDDWDTVDEDDVIEDEPTNIQVDNSFEDKVITDPTANAYKNIIIKKVNKLENIDNDQEYQINLQSLRQYIKRPEVVKALGKDLINNLISPVIG